MKHATVALQALVQAGVLLAAHAACACGLPLAVQRIDAAGQAATLLGDGSVWFEGQPGASPRQQQLRVPLLRDIVQLAFHDGRLYARQSDGRVWQWAPGSVAMPRPVQGLRGKAVDVAVAADGRLAVRVMRHALPTGLLAERPVELHIVGPLAVDAARPLPARYAQRDAIP